MTRWDYVAIALVLAALYMLPSGERSTIADQCRNLGAFEHQGVVFRCAPKKPKPMT